MATEEQKIAARRELARRELARRQAAQTNPADFAPAAEKPPTPNTLTSGLRPYTHGLQAAGSSTYQQAGNVFGTLVENLGENAPPGARWLAEKLGALADYSAPRDEMKGFVPKAISGLTQAPVEIAKMMVAGGGNPVLGVDPSPAMAKLARERGVETVVALFSTDVTERIQHSHGKAELIVANNVFNHADAPVDFVTAVAALLADNGTFVFELP